MKTNKFLLAAMALSVALYSCESDDNNNSDDPDVEGVLCINEVSAKGEDYVEIYNGTDSDINLNGYELNDGDAEDAFVISTDVVVESKGFVVFVKGDDDSFDFGISDEDVITLLDAEGESVDVSPSLDAAANVSGLSWGRTTDGGSTWAVMNATKGTSNDGNEYIAPDDPEVTSDAVIGEVLLNEIYSYSDEEDWIELYNTTDREIDLGGMRLWESGGSAEAWIFPSNTKIAANSYLVIGTDKDSEIYSDPANYPSWGLSKGGDLVVLGNSELEIFDEITFPSLLDGETYGRVTDGADELMIFATGTKGYANGGETRQDIISTTIFVNEVYTDNTDDYEAADWDPTLDFIELYNGTSEDVDISGWEIYDDKGEDQFIVPEGTVIPAGGFVVFQAYDDDYIAENDGSYFEFGLGKSGDWVFLYTEGKGELVDRLEVPGLEDDEEDLGLTYGRYTDGTQNLQFFTVATPGKANVN